MKLAALLVGILLLAGCSTEVSTPPDQCSAEACGNLDLGASKCDSGRPTDRLSPRALETSDMVGPLKGTLMLKRSGISRCKDVYWAEFKPTNSNTARFAVVFKLSALQVQAAIAAAPAQPTRTKGVYATELQTINACVRWLDASGKQQGTDACLSAVRPML